MMQVQIELRNSDTVVVETVRKAINRDGVYILLKEDGTTEIYPFDTIKKVTEDARVD